MDQFEYMKMLLDIFPQSTIHQYNLTHHARTGFVYLEIRKVIYGLPQAGILANQLLRKRLWPQEYYKVAHMTVPDNSLGSSSSSNSSNSSSSKSSAILLIQTPATYGGGGKGA